MPLLSDVASFITNSLTGTSNGFMNHDLLHKGYLPLSTMTTGDWILFTIIYLMLLFLIMWAGSYIFNDSVVKIMPFIKKTTPFDFFGLYIVLHLLFC